MNNKATITLATYKDEVQAAKTCFDDVQKLRYAVGGKGADGDPPYARDISLMTGKYRKNLVSCIRESDGTYCYTRDGD